jgi:hypothetical protein
MLKRIFIWIFYNVEIFLSFIVLSTIIGCSQNTLEMQSNWTPELIEIDGYLYDWTDKPMTYFKDEEVSLGILNDNENLYVLFCFRNDQWAQLIRMGGVTLWFDNKGEKNKDFGIRYKGGPPPAEIHGDRRVQIENLPGEQRERFKESQGQESQLIIIDKGKHTITIPGGSHGVSVNSSISQGLYIYEFRVPIKDKEKEYHSINTQPGQTIDVGFEWGLSEDEIMNMRKELDIEGDDMERPPRGSGMQSPNDEGGMEPPAGGDMRPDRGMRPGGSRQLVEKKEIWVKVSLATPKEE